MPRRTNRAARARRATRTRRRDRYRLYQEAVQDAAADIAFVQRVFRRRFGREPRLLREDFCGTALFACAWVRGRPANRAWGIDLDPEPLAWGREHNVAALRPSEARRVRLIQGDVLDVSHERVDVTVAYNFSYFVFKTREQLVRYFAKARTTLHREGLFFVDLYGGADAQRRMTETREHDGFDYVWDQDVFDPITHHAVNHIHFRFPDGSRMQRAFSYDWRLWTIPEVRDALEQAGFSSSQAYWERTDRATNEGMGSWYAAEHAADDPAWIAYVVASR